MGQGLGASVALLLRVWAYPKSGCRSGATRRTLGAGMVPSGAASFPRGFSGGEAAGLLDVPLAGEVPEASSLIQALGRP